MLFMTFKIMKYFSPSPSDPTKQIKKTFRKGSLLTLTLKLHFEICYKDDWQETTGNYNVRGVYGDQGFTHYAQIVHHYANA